MTNTLRHIQHFSHFFGQILLRKESVYKRAPCIKNAMILSHILGVPRHEQPSDIGILCKWFVLDMICNLIPTSFFCTV
jgi:hypothetical protein